MDILVLIIERAICLVAPALVDAPRTHGSLYHRLVEVLTLATQLVAHLPRLAEYRARRQKPQPGHDKLDGPERPERLTREGRETFGPTRSMNVPALVARIGRELLAIAKLVSPDAHQELTALTTRAKQAAQSWQPIETPETPKIPACSASSPQPADTLDDKQRRLRSTPSFELQIRGQGSG